MTATLLLSKSLEPVKIISWQRAISLLTLGKIEILATHDEEVRSPSMVIKIPAVARLMTAFKKPKNKKVRFSRINVFARDKYRCQYCGIKQKIADLTYDHVIPKSHGGRSCFENIVSACYACNLKKGSRTPEQANMRLIKQPVEPKYVTAMILNIPTRDYHESWRSYLYWTEELDE